jgi:hypothetical protein
MQFSYEYTDTFSGQANYSWVKRGNVYVPELTHYGYDGSNGYARADRAQSREVVRLVKAALGLTGVKCRRETWGDTIALYPYGANCVVFINYLED